MQVFLGFAAGTRVSAEIQVTVGITEDVEDQTLQKLPEGLPIQEPLTATSLNGLSLLTSSILPICPTFALHG